MAAWIDLVLRVTPSDFTPKEDAWWICACADRTVSMAVNRSRILLILVLFYLTFTSVPGEFRRTSVSFRLLTETLSVVNAGRL